MPRPETSQLIYSLDRPLAYRVVTLTLVAFALVLGWLALALSSEKMVAEFGSIAAGRFVQAALLVVGLGALAAWLWFQGRYVRRIAWLPATGQVELERGGMLRPRIQRLAPEDFIAATAHEGRSDFVDAPSVRAPYRRLRIQGSPTLILDEQGTVHDRRALDLILRGRSPETKTKPRPRPR